MKVWASLLTAGVALTIVGYLLSGSGWVLVVLLASPFVGVAVTEAAIRRWGLP